MEFGVQSCCIQRISVAILLVLANPKFTVNVEGICTELFSTYTQISFSVFLTPFRIEKPRIDS
jgi:hypothetical protein